MTIEEFNAALYYAVREDFNDRRDPAADNLIMLADRYVLENGFPDTPYVCRTSVAALARAVARRRNADRRHP